MVDFDYARQVSHSTSILEVLDYYKIEYFPNGPDRFKCICPFHDDHTPSMQIYVNPEHKDESYCCYVHPSEAAGDVLHFIRNMEGGDFQQAWTILCHINGIQDSDANSVDQLDSLLYKKEKQESRSISALNYQISIMYRDYIKQIKSSDKYDKICKVIDKRFKMLDQYLSNSPSYADMRQYYKYELDYLKKLRQKVNSEKSL